MSAVIQFPNAVEPEELPPHDMPEVMSPQFLADYFETSVKTLERWRERREGPEFFKLPGERMIRYHRDDVSRWLTKLRKGETS